MLYNEKDIIKKCKRGDRKAQEELFRRFGPKMMGICLRYTNHKEQAQDLLHDGFIKVFTRIEGFKEQSSLQTWMSTIFVNTAIDFLKKKKHAPFLLPDDFEESYADETAGKEDPVSHELSADEALELVQQLPEKYRLIVNLYCVDGFTHVQIAKLLGISEGTSKSQLSRARTKLLDLLQQKKRMYERA